jgi:hypothetical protein
MEKDIQSLIEARQLDKNSRHELLSYAIFARLVRENTIRQYGIKDPAEATWGDRIAEPMAQHGQMV